MSKIFLEDFNDFNIGEFPYDIKHSALGEYHSVTYPGYKGNWYDPISLHYYRSKDGSWMITYENNKKYMEQNRGSYSKRPFTHVYSTLVYNKALFAPYELSVNLRVFNNKEFSGVSFNYQTSRDNYTFGIKGNKCLLIKREEETLSILNEIEINYSDLNTYNLHVVLDGKKAFCYLNNEMIFENKVSFIPNTKTALVSKTASRYSDFKIEFSDLNYQEHLSNLKSLEENNLALINSYPKLKLINKFKLNGYGSGRQVRMFKANGKSYFCFMQHQKRIERDSYARLSCLSCFDSRGNLIWNIGTPNDSYDTTMISADLPVQIADLFNDGKKEIIFAMDFYIYIADCLTGTIIKKWPTPVVSGLKDFDDYPFYRLNPDCIRVADLSGVGYKNNILIKDRYHTLFACDLDGNILFKYNHKNTGHFPYVFDYNNDSKDEFLIGYDLVNNDGSIVFSLPFNTDHTDEIIYVKPNKSTEEKFYLASGNEGFNIINKDGSLFKHNEIGHAQRISFAKYDGYQENTCLVTTFWGSDGIVHSFDPFGNKRLTKEFIEKGVLLSPVNYDGEHILSLVNGTSDGGLIDANLNTCVKFPDDSHPTLCAEVYDIDGDSIDEIILFDQKEVWIYKTETILNKGKDYNKYPEDSGSNYRGEYLTED